jgi:hypothetical protein
VCWNFIYAWSGQLQANLGGNLPLGEHACERSESFLPQACSRSETGLAPSFARSQNCLIFIGISYPEHSYTRVGPLLLSRTLLPASEDVWPEMLGHATPWNWGILKNLALRSLQLLEHSASEVHPPNRLIASEH